MEQWNSTNGQLDKFIHIIGAMLDTPIGSSGAVVSSNVAMAMAGRVLPARNDERTRKDYDATGERLDTGKFESWWITTARIASVLNSCLSHCMICVRMSAIMLSLYNMCSHECNNIVIL